MIQLHAPASQFRTYTLVFISSRNSGRSAKSLFIKDTLGAGVGAGAASGTRTANGASLTACGRVEGATRMVRETTTVFVVAS
jgi:hypothetical protein